MAQPPSDSSFTTDVARFYESNLVPLIFEPYAADLAERARSLEPRSLLEVACGTGVVTRALASALPTGSAITATDLNDAMVTHGEMIGTTRPVRWQQADVMSLPFPDGSFDVAVCQFAVMFFPDRIEAYREIRRVLRPGGTFLFNLWNGIEHNDFARTITEALRGLYPGDPPAFLARTPHGYWNPAEVEPEVRTAGFDDCRFSQRDDVSSATAPGQAAIAYCHGTPLKNEIIARDPTGLDRATEVAAEALRARFGDGSINGRISAVVVEAN